MRIKHTNNNKNDAAASTTFEVKENDPIPAGIEFEMATNAPSYVAINIRWNDGTGDKYHSYEWNELSQAFVYYQDNTNSFNLVDLGNTALKKTAIIFGSEITEESWRGKNFTLQFRYKTKSVTNDFDISIKNFKFVYYDDVEINEGDTCVKEEAKPITWATITWPKSVEGYVGTADTFYGRVNINGLTDTTENWDKSVALMGVKAQLCVRPKYSDMLYTDCNDAKAVVSDHSDGEAFGGNNEYEVPYTFENTGDYEYTFRFSSDNGKNWTWIDYAWENSTNIAYATILEVLDDTIPNGDFKYWSGDNPYLWTVKDSKFSKITVDEENKDYALQVKRTNGSAGAVFDTPKFKISGSKFPSKITFKIATDTKVKMSLQLCCANTCGTNYYPWNKNEGAFTNANNNYNDPVTFGNTDFKYNTEIRFGSEVADSFWQGKECYIEFRYGGDSNEVWAKFDNFTIVPAE